MTELSVFVVMAILSAAPLALGVGYLSIRRPLFGARRFMTAVAAGFAAIIPASIIQLYLPPLGKGAANLFFYAFAIIALTEEGAKFVSVRALRKRWGDPENAIPAGMAASLGFAFFETIVYASANPSAAIVRAFTAAPLHAACGAWIGKAAGFPTFSFGTAAYCALAILVHGSYDLSLLVPGFPIIIPILIAIGGLGLSITLLRFRSNRDF